MQRSGRDGYAHTNAFRARDSCRADAAPTNAGAVGIADAIPDSASWDQRARRSAAGGVPAHDGWLRR